MRKHAAPFISDKNQIKWLKRCKERQTWTKKQLRQIVWSDESPVVLKYNWATRVWRVKSEKNVIKGCLVDRSILDKL